MILAEALVEKVLGSAEDGADVKILDRFPGVLVVAVYPVPDPRTGDQVMAAMVLRDGERIEADDLHVAGAPQPLRIVSATPVAAVAAAPAEPIRLRDVAHHSKLEAIRTALRETDGHRAAAARKLGISVTALKNAGAEQAMTTDEIRALLEDQPEWLQKARATLAEQRGHGSSSDGAENPAAGGDD